MTFYPRDNLDPCHQSPHSHDANTSACTRDNHTRSVRAVGGLRRRLTICLTNNAAERALRGIALGRKNWLFTGSDRGGRRAAIMYSLIITAKMNDIDPQAWLADVLARIAEHPARKIDELLPWNWKIRQVPLKHAA